jgi:DtxR family Mn-dependent transcriptional regulator
MLPSQTVENYLKTIFLAQASLGADDLVPMGQLASSLGVVPGTATTMVKTLSESGLVHYEPYMGVRLTSAGEKTRQHGAAQAPAGRTVSRQSAGDELG